MYGPAGRRKKISTTWRFDSSSFHGCSIVRAWRPFLRPGLRVQTGRAQGVVKARRRAGLPLASMLPGHALTEASGLARAMQLASNKRIASYTRRFRRQEE